MNGINLNLSGNSGKPQVPPGGNASVKAESTQNAPSFNPQTANNAPVNPQLNSTTAQITDRLIAKSIAMNNMELKEMANLLKELMSFPKDVQSLLALLAFGDATPEQLAKMLKDTESKFLLADLQKLIGSNSKEVIQKLIHLTKGSALFAEGQDQLRDILNLLQKITTMANNSPSDALNAVMILYLPWLPLAQQQKLDLAFGFEESESEEAESDGKEVLVLFIQTANLGLFKVTILTESDKSMEVDIESDQAASESMNSITSQIHEELGSHGLTTKIATLTRKEAVNTPIRQLKTEAEKGITIHPSGKISTVTVNAGYITARIIFNEDEKSGVKKLREEKIK